MKVIKLYCLLVMCFCINAQTVSAQTDVISADSITKSLLLPEQKDLQIDRDEKCTSSNEGEEGCGATRGMQRIVDSEPIYNASINLDAVTFEFDSAILTSRAKQQIEQIAIALSSKSLEGKYFELIGHTDAQGSEGYNLSLSTRRAKAVVDFLVRQYGVSKGNIESYGMGENKPVNQNDPYAAENRRVEIVAR